MAAKIVIEPVFEADFQSCSYGFRPKRNAKQAIDKIYEVADKGGALWVIDADIRDYFGSINHDKPLLLVKQRITDRRVLKLIKGWLKAGVLENGQSVSYTHLDVYKRQDLYRLMEGLAVKKGLVKEKVSLSRAAWGASGLMLHPHSTTNFSRSDIQNIFEQFHLLLNQGIIAPGAVGNYGHNLPYFHVTEYGLKCLEELEILPYDIDGYFDKIKSIPSISEWTEFYIKQALQCYNACLLYTSRCV